MPRFNWKQTIRPWVAAAQTKGQHKDNARGRSPHAYEPRYNSARWKRLREIVLQKSPLCLHCRDAGRVTPARVVDHVRPVRRGGAFWDIHNLQSLCQSCHDAKSGRESHGLDGFAGDRGSKNRLRVKHKTVGSKMVGNVSKSEGV